MNQNRDQMARGIKLICTVLDENKIPPKDGLKALIGVLIPTAMEIDIPKQEFLKFIDGAWDAAERDKQRRSMRRSQQ